MFFVETIVYGTYRFMKREFRFGCFICCCVLLVSVLVVSCSGFNVSQAGPSASTSTTQSVTVTGNPQMQVALRTLHWCGKPLLLFRDEGAAQGVTPTLGGTPAASPTVPSMATPRTISDWSQIEGNLGFTLYLPKTLPGGSCLASASGTLHDPILGSSFTIGYLLPSHDSISLSEAPLLSQNTTFQCSVSTETGASSAGGTATPAAATSSVQLCTGAREKTSVVLSARGTQTALEQFFNALQPRVSWIPSS